MTELLTYRDIAELTGLRVDTLRGYKADGNMPQPDGYVGEGKGGRPWWYPETIDAWQAERDGDHDEG